MLPALVATVDRTEAEVQGWVDRLRDRGTGWPVVAGAAGTEVDADRRRLAAGRVD